MNACISCGAPIAWAMTDSGARMPLDVPSTDTGNVAAHRDESGVLRARVLPADVAPARHERLTTSHFASCPNAAEHRRRRAAPREQQIDILEAIAAVMDG